MFIGKFMLLESHDEGKSFLRTPAEQEEWNMGKDSGWKRYFSDNRRYADIINGIGCEGKQLVRETDLDDADSQAGTKKTRDLIRRTAFGINFALIGIENQDTIDYELPLRMMHYDVTQYEKQAAEILRTVCENRSGLRAGEYLYVRRHIVGGANRTLISALLPPRLCRIGTCRRLSTGRPQIVVSLFEGQPVLLLK